MFTILYFIGLTIMSTSLWLTVPADGLMMQGVGILVYAVVVGFIKFIDKC